ncbi:MAG TPA: glycosyltransferase family 4 protein [Syntrophorhabdaceae bacterium]|nr:glycosyltransferase family 4 protein [Syntrophorhabdaceae bacterium]HOL04749.1 glycosyltransferase family 4 protein [Syntrophorhabdaceae bacterium]
MKPTITLFMSSVGTTFGGSETYTINMAKHLCRDFNVKIILGSGRFTEDFNTLVNNYPVQFLSVPFISRHSKFSAFWRKTNLNKKINDFDIETLSIMLSIKKINRFLSDTDILEVQYPTEALIFPFIKKDIKKMIHFHGYQLPPLFIFFRKKVTPFIYASIVNSHWSKKVIEEKINLKNLKVIYNGIDVDIFKPFKSNEFIVSGIDNPDLPRIGTVGRLSRAKGTDLLLKVALEMQGVANFFAVGPCEEELLDEIKKNNLANFHLLGSLSNKILPFFYNFIDCYTLPSLFEAFGITLIEAMACGKPVIASNVGGIPEIIEDGISGILITPGDFKALKEAIIKIISNKDLQMHLGNCGRQKVLSEFTFEKTYNELKEFYFSLLKSY